MPTEYVVWGYKPFLPEPYPIRLTGGTLRHCRAAKRLDWEVSGWQCAIYRKGDTPAGLRDQVYAAHGRPCADFLAAINA